MAKKNEVKVSITGDAKDLVAATATADGALGGFAGKLGGFAGSMGTLALTAGAGIAAGIGAAAVGLYKVGESFDAAYDSIRVTTGATGSALEGLKDDFRQVVQTVPTDFESASTAVAQLSQRLGLSGPALQGVSAQVLELSRLTGSDLSSTIASTTRVMGDWGIANEQVPGTLDAMFRASQATGISVDSLSEKVVQFGAPLRQLGFSFAESATMVGQFEKTGVNSELVLGSMRVALTKMARDGEPAAETFRRMSDEIKNAGSTTEANAKAMELFGAKAGPDMAAAIREGRFELGTLLDTVSNGSETILGASADTMDLSQKFTLLKNRAFVALEPVASRLFGLLGQGMDALGPVFSTVSEAASGFFAVFSSGAADPNATGITASLQEYALVARDAFDAVVSALQTVGQWISDHREQIGQVVAFAVNAFATYGRVFLDVVGRAFEVIGTVASWLWTNVIQPFAEWVSTDGVAAWQTFSSAIGAAWDWITNAVGAAVAWFQTNVAPTIGAVVQFMSVAFEGFRTVVGAVWNFIQPLVSVAMTFIGGAISVGLGFISAVWNGVWTTIQGVVSTAWQFIQNAVTAALGVIRGIFQFATAFLTGNWSGAWDAIKSVVSNAWNLITSGVSFGIGLVRAALSGAGAFISSVFSDPLRAMIDAVSGSISWVVSLFSGVKDSIGSAFSGLASAISSPFSSAFSSIRSLWNNSVGGFSFSVPDWIPLVGGRSFSIPQMATGGRVLRSGYAMVGELGPEIVQLPTGSNVYPSGYGPAGGASNVVYELHFHGPVTRDAERWLVDTLSRANRQGLAAVPGVA